MVAGDPEVGQVYFPEVSGLVGDHSERCAWDLARSVMPDVDLKQKEDCCYRMLLVGGVRLRMGRRIGGM